MLCGFSLADLQVQLEPNMVKTTSFVWALLSQFHSFQVLHVSRINLITRCLRRHFCRETEHLCGFQTYQTGAPGFSKEHSQLFDDRKKKGFTGCHAKKDG